MTQPFEHGELVKVLRTPYTAYKKIGEVRELLNKAADAIEARMSHGAGPTLPCGKQPGEPCSIPCCLDAPPSSIAPLAEWLREHAPDCGDNSCLFGGRGKGGMRTNGGCRCFKDVRPDMKRIFIERMWAALSAPSATLPPDPKGFTTSIADSELSVVKQEESHTCQPCGTSWTAPVEACPACGKVPQSAEATAAGMKFCCAKSEASADEIGKLRNVIQACFSVPEVKAAWDRIMNPGRPVKPHRSGGGHWVGDSTDGTADTKEKL